MSCYSNIRRYKHHSEIIETEISDWRSQTYLPRHMFVPETKSHRGRHNLGKIDRLPPRICHIEPAGKKNTNLAVNILKYQLSDRASQQKHLENLRRNLEHRLQVAKSQGNSQLLNLLQEEYRQLKTAIY